jgi:hypothetical protein
LSHEAGEPKLVFKAAFVEWTYAGHLRHCAFIAMGDDKGSPGVRNSLPRS